MRMSYFIERKVESFFFDETSRSPCMIRPCKMIFLSIDRARVLLHGRMKDQKRLSQSRLKMLIDSLRISRFSCNRLKSFRGAVS